jgi:hypothetical protein
VKIEQLRRYRPRSDALILRAAPTSIVEYRLQNCFTLSASSMPPLDFQCVTHRMNILNEHSNYMNFTLHDEQNRQQDNVHRPRTGNPALLMFMCSDGNYNHANPFRNGRGRSKSVSWAIQPLLSLNSNPPCNYKSYRVDSFQTRAALTNRNSRVSQN